MRLAHQELEPVFEILKLVRRRGIFLQRQQEVIAIELVLDHDHVVLLLVVVFVLLAAKLGRAALRSLHLLVLGPL